MDNKLKSTSLILFLSLVFISCINTRHKESKNGNPNNCFEIVKAYSMYWKNDSLGQNGLRRVLADKFLIDCSFRNMEWKNLKDLLGKPNYSFKQFDFDIQRYCLTRIGETQGSPGNYFFDVHTDPKSSIVLKSIVILIDG